MFTIQKSPANTLPIQRRVHDVANMELYKTHLQVLELNPHATLAGIKTDMLAYTNSPKMIPTHPERCGEVKVEKVPEK